MRLALLIFALLPTAAAAQGFVRPVPNAQTATAELWFALASAAFVVALYAVHRLVHRR